MSHCSSVSSVVVGSKLRVIDAHQIHAFGGRAVSRLDQLITHPLQVAPRQVIA